MNAGERATRHVLVTGAASGIGAAICRRFAGDGDRLTMIDLQADRLSSFAEELRATHAIPVTTISGDLADESFLTRVIGEAWTVAGPIDVAVLAAGVYPAIPLLELTPRTWDHVQHVNVRAPMHLTQTIAKHAIAAKRPAIVVHISSGAAQRARRGAAHYSASKAALEMLTRSAALELGPHGIRVNAVSPGFVDVSSDANPVSPEYAGKMSMNPLGRPGRPDDVAAAVYWLSGPDAAWVTGTVLRVDGGASAGNASLPLHWPGPAAMQLPQLGDPGDQ